MTIIIKLLIGLIAFQHLYFLWLEMFAWTTHAKKVFKSLPKHLFEETKGLAANQGLYNGFLSAGLIWSLIIQDPVWSVYVAMFFAGCVSVAGMFGGYSVHKKIFFIQGVPAIALLFLLYLSI